MQKRFFTAFAVFIWATLSFAQIHEPVKWNFSSKNIKGNDVELILTAVIEKGWHLYSQNLPSDEGPIATSFNFNKNSDFELIGNVVEPKPKTDYDPNFDMEIPYFDTKVDFKQKIKLLTAKTTITGELEFMVCNDKMCLPPEIIEFSIEAIGSSVPSETSSNQKTNPNTNKPEKLFSDNKTDITIPQSSTLNQVELVDPVKLSYQIKKLTDSEGLLQIKFLIDKHWHLYSLDTVVGDGPLPTEFNLKSNGAIEPVGDLIIKGLKKEEYDSNFLSMLKFYEDSLILEQRFKVLNNTMNLEAEIFYMACDNKRCIFPDPFEVTHKLTEFKQASNSTVESTSGMSLWKIFIAGFLGGFLALLTPCVFPMIPLTVSFFTKQSKTRAKGISNALIYGLSIILIYVALGFGVTKIFGADALNALSTNVWFNLAFFALLVVFAISFFGAFEITLPSSWINNVDRASDKGGLIGIFFMAFTLSLVSFSCTGPIIGTLLVEAAVNGGVTGPLVGMFGFSSALALPFALFAAFPGWLNSLPQSGGWLNSVKVTLGFLELALALKFLSNADLVVQAHIITREVFLVLWIIIFGLMGIYLLGFIKLSHDSELKYISIPRLFMAIISLSFALYLIPGLWGAPLKIISGFPPPMFYSESPNGVGKTSLVQTLSTATQKVDGNIQGNPAHCPHGLNCFHDFETGVAYAKKVGKPVLLDFTGWACVNCRKMEDQVWSDPRVLQRLRENVVLISLYVDEKLNLPEEEQIEVTIGNKTKTLKTVGNKWSYFQASKYGTNSQPYYLIVDYDGNPMHESAAYDPDIEKYIEWLDRGTKLFHENQKSKS